MPEPFRQGACPEWSRVASHPAESLPACWARNGACAPSCPKCCVAVVTGRHDDQGIGRMRPGNLEPPAEPAYLCDSAARKARREHSRLGVPGHADQAVELQPELVLGGGKDHGEEKQSNTWLPASRRMARRRPIGDVWWVVLTGHPAHDWRLACEHEAKGHS